MAEGVDYSFARPSPTGLYAAGKRFAGRYVGPGSGKLLGPAERDALFAAGLDIFLLAEGNADSALGGFSVGVSHAASAQAAAKVLGAPASLPIYFAVDFDVTASQWGVVAQYLRGAASVIGTPRVGIYGGIRSMQWAARDGVAAWFFQTYAWSGGAWYAGNHVEQWKNGVIVAGGEVDLCRSMKANFGQWSVNMIDERVFNNLANVISGWALGLDEVNQKLADGSTKLSPIHGLYDAVAQRVLAAGGGGDGTGGGASPAQVAAAVRAELDKTSIESIPGRLDLAD